MGGITYRLSTNMTWGIAYGQLDKVFERWHVQVDDYRVLFDTTAVRDGRRMVFSRDQRRVEVEFKHPSGRSIRVSYDRQPRPQDNLRAITLCLDDMRMIEVRGMSDLVGSAYLQLNGAVAPPAEERPMTIDEAYAVLCIQEGASRALIDYSYRQLAFAAHPDTGGTNEAMIRLQQAYKLVREANGL